MKQQLSSNLKYWTPSRTCAKLWTAPSWLATCEFLPSAAIWSSLSPSLSLLPPPHTHKHTHTHTPAPSLSLPERTAASRLWSPNFSLFLNSLSGPRGEWTSLFNIFRPTSSAEGGSCRAAFSIKPPAARSLWRNSHRFGREGEKETLLKSTRICLTADGKLVGGKAAVWVSLRTQTPLLYPAGKMSDWLICSTFYVHPDRFQVASSHLTSSLLCQAC